MNQKVVLPTWQARSFNCPHCFAFSGMQWEFLFFRSVSNVPSGYSSARCHSCSKTSIWRLGIVNNDYPFDLSEIAKADMVYPQSSAAVLPHPAMPPVIQDDFEEARQVAVVSPRAAAALLRLCLEKLCRTLTGKTSSINDQIGDLVNQGLPIRIQKAMDALRVIGNDAVHPGTLDLNADPELVTALFRLVNVIVEVMIAQPAAIEDIYDLLPDGKRQGIESRDAKKP